MVGCAIDMTSMVSTRGVRFFAAMVPSTLKNHFLEHLSYSPFPYTFSKNTRNT